MNNSHEIPKRPNKGFATIIIVGTLGAFLVGLFWSYFWSPEWINVIGAALVAAGGVAGCLSQYDVAPEHARPFSWSLVMNGGAAITAASIAMAI